MCSSGVLLPLGKQIPLLPDEQCVLSFSSHNTVWHLYSAGIFNNTI